MAPVRRDAKDAKTLDSLTTWGSLGVTVFLAILWCSPDHLLRDLVFFALFVMPCLAFLSKGLMRALKALILPSRRAFGPAGNEPATAEATAKVGVRIATVDGPAEAAGAFGAPRAQPRRARIGTAELEEDPSVEEDPDAQGLKRAQRTS